MITLDSDESGDYENFDACDDTYGANRDAAEPERPDDADVSELLALNPASLMQQATRVHGIMIRWTAYTAECKKHYQLMKFARDTRLSEAKESARARNKSLGEPTSVAVIDAQACRDSVYKDIAREVISAEAEWETARGVVNAIFTKRDMIKSLLYSMGDAAKLAVEQSSPDSMDFSVDERNRDALY